MQVHVFVATHGGVEDTVKVFLDKEKMESWALGWLSTEYGFKLCGNKEIDFGRAEDLMYEDESRTWFTIENLEVE